MKKSNINILRENLNKYSKLLDDRWGIPHKPLAEQNSAAMGYIAGRTTLEDVLEDLNVYIDFITDPIEEVNPELLDNPEWVKISAKLLRQVQSLWKYSRAYLIDPIESEQVLDDLAATVYDGSDAYEPSILSQPVGLDTLHNIYKDQLQAWEQAIEQISQQ